MLKRGRLNTNMENRFKILRTILGLSSVQIAEELGITQPTVSRIETGKTKLSTSITRLICLTYNVNETWLRTGEGEIFTSKQNKSSNLSLLEQLQEEYNLHNLEVSALVTYLNLPIEERQFCQRILAKFVTNSVNQAINCPPTNSHSLELKADKIEKLDLKHN